MVAERIRNRRIELQLTQKEIADRLKVTYQTISKYERGVNIPDAETLKSLSDILQCSTDYLVGKVDSPSVQIVSYNDKELGHIEVGIDNYPYQLTPEEVEEMIATLKKYHFNVDAIIEDMRNKNKKEHNEK